MKRTIFQKYKKMYKSKQTENYIYWENMVVEEVKKLSDVQLYGWKKYFERGIMQSEKGKTYSMAVPYIALLAVVAPLLAALVSALQDKGKMAAYLALAIMVILVGCFCMILLETSDNIKRNIGYVYYKEMDERLKEEIEHRCIMKNIEYKEFKKSLPQKQGDEIVRSNVATKQIIKRELKRVGGYGIYYLIIFLVMQGIGFIKKDIGITSQSVVVDILCLCFGLMILVGLNIWFVINTKKDLEFKGDVDSILQKVPIEKYYEILKELDVSVIIDMYRKIHNKRRRNFDVSARTFIGTVIVAALPALLAGLMSMDVILSGKFVIYIGVFLMLFGPIFFEMFFFFVNIIDGDNVGKTASLEKEVQDALVTRLFNEYMGIID